jgi:hypothetical protein
LGSDEDRQLAFFAAQDQVFFGTRCQTLAGIAGIILAFLDRYQLHDLEKQRIFGN